MDKEVHKFLQQEIEKQHIPGAVLQVRHDDEILLEEAYGYRSVYPEKEPMQKNTIFDLASLTKVIATLPIYLKLVDEGIIRLEDKVTRFLPSFGGHGKENITLRQLLTHSSGLQAHAGFVANDIKHKEALIAFLNDEKLVYQSDNDVVYSDVGYALLSIIAEEITGISFDLLVQEEVFQKLDMRETTFNPVFPVSRFAATEYDEHLHKYKRGTVHDENAFIIGGVSGHAGLFSTISDIGNFAQMIVNDGVFKGKRFLSDDAIRISKRNYTPFSTMYRGIGWELNGAYAASCGDYFSTESFGHTGFTGTSIWFDPKVDLVVTFLTNRVHFGRSNHMLSLRPRLHNIIRKYFHK